MTRAAIVGAGWAGLAAGVALAERGIAVSVFEASRNLGGRARRVRVEDVDLDNGQHILIGAYCTTLDMMRKVGVDLDCTLLRLPLTLQFLDGFHLRAPKLPSPANLLLALLGARGLSLSQVLSALRFMVALRRTGFRVDPDTDVASFLRTHGQDGPLLRHVWIPLCVSALNTPAGIASAQVFANVLRDALGGARARSDLLLPCVNLDKIFPEPAAVYIRDHGGVIETGAAVRGITQVDRGFRLDPDCGIYSHVVIATAPQHTPVLLDGFPELQPTRQILAAFEFEPIATCYQQYTDTVHLAGPMIGFTDGLTQWAFDRGQLSGNRGLIASVVSASGPHQRLHKDEFALQVHRDLARVIRNLPVPRWSRVIEEKRATFSCRPGMVRPTCTTGVPGLLLAGDYVASEYPGTLEAAVRSGLAAAAEIMQA